MFTGLSERLNAVFDKLTRRGILTESAVDETMREIKIALLEADVALPVVKSFIATVKEKAVGEQIIKSVSPAQQVVKIVHDELVALLGESKPLALLPHKQNVILMVGLQGSGKTTSCAKLAKRLQKDGKKVLTASLDVYRPAAQEQLAELGSKNQFDVLPIVDAIRSFRDLAARKILDPKSREKRDYARALKEMSQGRPDRATRLMKKELVRQQQVLFGLKDKLLQQYARKEAAQLALHLGLILGMYDTQLADKAFRRAMELNPKDSKGLILFGRFRQKTAGQQDKVMEKTFLKLAKGIDRTLQNYMLNYAVEMVRKSEIRSRQEEIRNRIQDEKERYNEAVNVERLKVREALKLARMRDIADEVRVR